MSYYPNQNSGYNNGYNTGNQNMFGQNMFGNQGNQGMFQPYNSQRNVFQPFYSQRTTGPGFRDFLESNTIVAKLAFLFLILFLFVILLRIGINIMTRVYASNESPHIFDGMVNAKQMQVFPQDPSVSNSKTITRSMNATQGIEFTWSAWIYIEDLQYLSGQYRHVFSKGNSDINSAGLAYPNNAPGVYITPERNDLLIIMNTFDVINEELHINDIPLNKWVNIVIRCHNKTLDVYINGTIAKSIELVSVPKQNYGDVFVGLNGGFDGNVSNLWYYNYALGTTDIQNLVMKGPNTKMVNANMNMKRLMNYLSLRWYFSGSHDQFNP